MEATMEKECSALGGLFQAVINDLKVGVPVWEDFLAKASKLHSQLKATILATTAFLDAFQKIADLASNTRGGTKEIGTALTRICLRHKAVEARMKTFTSAIMECLVLPLQDKMEEWKKTVAQLDKDHAKEYKRARNEIKKKSSDTLRLQKKVRKGKCEIQRSLDTAMHDVSEKFYILEETEKHALRMALIEERSRFCLFVSFMKPVVDEEVSMLTETTHLQEIMEQLLKHTTDPFTLPETSEQIINDVKSSEGSFSYQTPPSSPSSVGSRKSSMCSLGSVNSSSSGSTKCHSPSLHQIRYHRSHSQPIVAGTLRLTSVSSQDSGFTSQDTLFVRPHTPPPLELIRQMSGPVEKGGTNTGSSSNASTPSSPYGQLPIATATWPNLQDTGHFDKVPCLPNVGDRPHTISTAYERGHQRPPLTIHTFEPLDKAARQVNSTPSSPQGYDGPASMMIPPGTKMYDQSAISQRSETLQRSSGSNKSSKSGRSKSISHYATTPAKTAVMPDFNQTAPNQIVPQPLYVNMNELRQRPSISELQEMQSYAEDGTYSQSSVPSTMTMEGQMTYGSLGSNGSSGYGSQGMVTTTHVAEDLYATGDMMSIMESEASKYCTIPRYSDLQHLRPNIRPSSTAGFSNMSPYGTLQWRTGSLRRSGSQTYKPPPPVRRTSSISSQHALTVVQIRNTQSSQNLTTASSYSLSAIEGGGGPDDANMMAGQPQFSLPPPAPTEDDYENVYELNEGPSQYQQHQLPPPQFQAAPQNGRWQQDTDGDDGPPVQLRHPQRATEDHRRIADDHHRRASEDHRRIADDNRRVADDHRRASEDNRRDIDQGDGGTTTKVATPHVDERVIHHQANLMHSLSLRLSNKPKAQLPDSPPGAAAAATGNATWREQPTQQHIPPPPPPAKPQKQQQKIPPATLPKQQLQQQPSGTSSGSSSSNTVSSTAASSSTSTSDTTPSAAGPAAKYGFQESFLQNLNSKLALHVQANAPSPSPTQSPQSTPKGIRRGSAPATSQPPPASPLQNFKESLNARLANHQTSPKSSPPTLQKSLSASEANGAQRRDLAQKQPHAVQQQRANFAVRQHSVSGGHPATGGDPSSANGRLRQSTGGSGSCRESLLDQIKQGMPLRKSSTNDRSAPRIQ